MTEPTKGAIAYGAYFASCKGVSIKGDPLPPWSGLPEAIRGHWEAAAAAAATYPPSPTARSAFPPSPTAVVGQCVVKTRGASTVQIVAYPEHDPGEPFTWVGGDTWWVEDDGGRLYKQTTEAVPLATCSRCNAVVVTEAE